jgi:hypothetical protein
VFTYNCSDRSGSNIADVHPGKHNIFWNSLEATIKVLIEFSRRLVQRLDRINGLQYGSIDLRTQFISQAPGGTNKRTIGGIKVTSLKAGFSLSTKSHAAFSARNFAPTYVNSGGPVVASSNVN